MSVPGGLSRRKMFLSIAMLLNGVVGVFLAIPIVGYLLSPFTRGRKPGYDHPLLGAPHRWRSFPGIRHQLRASGLPRALVPAVGPLHVPLPRRRLLFGRSAGVRSAGAGLVRIPIQGFRWQPAHPGGRDAYTGSVGPGL